MCVFGDAFYCYRGNIVIGRIVIRVKNCMSIEHDDLVWRENILIGVISLQRLSLQG